MRYNFKLGMLIGLNERKDGVEDKRKTGGHHLGRGRPTFSSFSLMLLIILKKEVIFASVILFYLGNRARKENILK